MDIDVKGSNGTVLKIKSDEVLNASRGNSVILRIKGDEICDAQNGNRVLLRIKGNDICDAQNGNSVVLNVRGGGNEVCERSTGTVLFKVKANEICTLNGTTICSISSSRFENKHLAAILKGLGKI